MVRSYLGIGKDTRKRRAQEVGDDSYKPERKLTAAEDRELLRTSFPDARHLDCAPGHVQEAIARMKRGEHLNVPIPGGDQ